MKAVIFARVSTQEQEQDGHSISAQITKLREYCHRHNLEIIKEYEVVESSTRGERPEFYKMIDFVNAQSGTIALVCDKVDRLQRSFSELPTLDKLRKEGKLILHFLDIGKLDSDANSQQISFYQMSVVMANAYTNAISDNVKRSILYKLKNGECIGRAPLGYLNIKDAHGKSTVIIDKERAPLVKKLFELYARGSYALGDLEKFCKEHNLTNNFHKGQSNKPLTKSTIATLLKNPFYYGYMYVKKYNQFYKHRYEPLITETLYDTCQKITLDRNSASNRSQAVQKTGKKDFVFRGLIRCDVTGRTVSCDRKEAKKNKNTYLIASNPDDITKKVFVRESDVLDQITRIFETIYIPDSMLTEITDYLKKSHQTEKDHHAYMIQELRKKEDTVQIKINRLLDMFLEQSISEAMYKSKQKALEDELIRIRVEKQMHQEADDDFKTILVNAFILANKSGKLFKSSKTHQKRELINLVFWNLSLRGKKLMFTMRKPFDMMVNLRNCAYWLPGQDSNLRPIG